MSTKHVVILKNDAVGDLVHSLDAINNIISNLEIDKITIFISKMSKNFDFLFKHEKINIKIVNYNLTILNKISIFLYILFNKIERVYILAPKRFYYFLPIIFYKIKFYAICINNVKNYKRPSELIRRFLYKYTINDRSAVFKRKSTKIIQFELTSNNSSNEKYKVKSMSLSNNLKKHLPKNYFYFHAKKKILDELGWGVRELNIMFDKFLNYTEKVIFTKDIELDRNTEIFRNNFSCLDFKTNKYINKTKKIIFFDNIDGMDLYNVIVNSRKTIAFHGMMTNLASIEKKPVLDLFYCNIGNWNDYRNYRNSFYEFKPKYKNYDFIIPNKDIHKTLKKASFSLKK